MNTGEINTAELKIQVNQNINLWLTDVHQGDWTKLNVGGKAFHLAEMVRWGLNVPEFGVVSSEVYLNWKTNQYISSEVKTQIINSMLSWNSQYYAVRSSMTLEDGQTTSFAGIFETFLFVEKEDVLDKIIECYHSISSDRALMYMKSNHIKIDQIGISVVVQVMIDSRSSGVAFSRNPTGHSALTLIESGLGLGEGVVSGQVDVDRFKIDRFGHFWESHIVEKRNQCQFNKELKKVEIINSDDSRSRNASLSKEEALKIFSGLINCESKMNTPVDMEWTIDHLSRIYFLQVRPITQQFDNLNYFADTNLAESYPNLVSRFTADFVPKAYEKVIGETLKLIGARWENTPHSETMKNTLKGLISEVHGHLYYQLQNYYTVLYIFPGGKANIQAWHDMVGGNNLHIPYKKLNLFPGIKKWIPYLKLLYLLILHDFIFKKFIKNRFQELNEKNKLISEALNSHLASQLPKKIFEDVSDWGLTSFNDIYVILGLKFLNHLIKKYKFDPEIITEWLKTREGVDSLNALIEIKRLQIALNIQNIDHADEFWKLTDSIINTHVEAENPNWSFLFEQYNKRGWNYRSELIKEYLSKYGERCFEELKIESMPFSESPKEFFKVFKQDFSFFDITKSNSSHSELSDKSENSKNKFKTSLDINKYLKSIQSMSYLDRFILTIVLYWTRKAVAVRESTRLMRGRFYGLLRSAVLKTAQLFIEENSNFKIVKEDFFSLTMDELYQYGSNNLSISELAKIINTQKNKSKQHQTIEYPEFYSASLTDQEPYFLQNSEVNIEMNSKSLVGLGVSTGLVKGYALVLNDPRDALLVSDLSDKILITRSTDPAWIFIMSKCRGLISEKGSLLSHTAIVGRELGIPTIVGVRDATKRIQNNSLLQINGKTGLIEFI